MHAHATKSKSGRGSSSSSIATGSTHALLALQRAAGNKAVSAYLQRDPADAQPQHSSSASVTFSDLGTVEATSVSFPKQPAIGSSGGSGGMKPPEDALRDVSLTMPMTATTAKLVQAGAEGRPFKRVVISMGTMNVVLTDVFVSGDAISGSHGDAGGAVSVSLSAMTAHVEPITADAISGA